MGLLTRIQIREEVYFDLANRADTSADVGNMRGLNTTRVDLWINDTIRHISHPSVFPHRELMHTFTLPLVNAVNSYAFDPDPGGVEIAAIRFGSYLVAALDSPTVQKRKLSPQTDQWFANKTLNSGPPNTYGVEGSNILISPVPTTVEAGNLIKLHAWRIPANITADASTTVLSANWDEVVILGTRWRAELHLGLLELAAVTQQVFGALINEYQSQGALNLEDWDWVSDVKTTEYMERA